MANVGYINPEVAKMYGIPYNQLTEEQKKILHADSERRAKLIKEREEDVLKNDRKAFDDEAKMEKVLGALYKNCQKQIIADVAETMAKVKKAGGDWSYANQSALTRSRGLLEQITKQIHALGQKEEVIFTQGLSNIYTDQFLRELYGLGQVQAVKANFNKLNPTYIKKTLDYPWSGAMFSDRLWNDKETLGKNLRAGLTQSMILGEGIPEITERINKNINTARYNAERVARTETKRVSYVAQSEIWEDNGVKELRYLCANGGDSRACKVCIAEHNTVYPKGEEPTLPRHPNCRCTYAPVTKDTFEDNELNELTGSIRGAENYEKWRKEQERALKNSSKNDNISVEDVKANIKALDEQIDIQTKEKAELASIRRGFKDISETSYNSMEEVTERYNFYDNNIKLLEQEKDKLYTKLKKKEDELLKEASLKPATNLSYSQQKRFNFSDGTGSVVTKKVRDALVGTTPTGVKIVSPVNVNRAKQLLTHDTVASVLDTIPDTIKKHCKEIQLVDYYNPLDSYWSREYGMKNFYSYATGGEGGITFYRNDKRRGSSIAVNNSQDWIREVICHELGHTIDQKTVTVLGKLSSNSWGSDGAEYIDAINKDFAYCGELWASAYGASSNNRQEDFADSVAEFVINPVAFKKKFPNRYNYIEEVLNKL